MEFQLICPLGSGQQIEMDKKYEWKVLEKKCEGAVAMGRLLSDYTGLHIFPHLCFQTSEIARQQIFA